MPASAFWLVDWLILPSVGFASGILAGLLGVGGGTILVPVMVFLGIEVHHAIGTSTLAMVFTSLSGSLRNYRQGHLDAFRVLPIGLASVAGAQIGAFSAASLRERSLELLFAGLLITITLIAMRRKSGEARKPRMPLLPGRILTGLCGGFLSGLFGIGGGVVMVPMQILLLGEDLLTAVRTSLGVIVITALGAAAAHAMHGHVLLTAGIMLGLGGILGAQIGTRALPRLPENVVKFVFAALALMLAVALIFRAEA